MKKKLNLQQIIFFGLVGLVTLAIDVVVTKTLYQYVGLPAYLSSAFGFLLGFFFNFPMNRNKVFKHSSNDRFLLRSQIAMVLSLSIFNLIFTSAFVDTLVRLNVMDIVYVKMLATAIIAAWNFAIFKWFIFSKH